MAAQFENNRDISYVNLRCLSFAPTSRSCTTTARNSRVRLRKLFHRGKNLIVFFPSVRKYDISLGDKSIEAFSFYLFVVVVVVVSDPDISSN